MNKRKKIILIMILTIFIISAIIIIYKYIQKKASNHTSIDDFINVKEIVEYYNCTYTKTTISAEDNYSNDIYIVFGLKPIDEYGNVKKSIYENIIGAIESKVGNKNIRIIDESKGLIIRVIYNKDKETAEYTINNDDDYFNTILIQYQKNTKINSITQNTTSKELQSIIKANWIRRDSDLGTIDTTVEDYDNYYDEGYSIKTVGNKIFNIIFTKKYTSTISNNIKTGMNNSDIEQILGTPNFKDKNANIIGYKTNNYYEFFNNGEISIYRIQTPSEEENKKFAELFTTLNKDGDYATFLDGLTDIYPDYDKEYKSENYVDLIYSLYGFEIKFGANEKNGITIYNNYTGYVTNDITIEDIMNNGKIPKNVYTKLDIDLVYSSEISRIAKEETNRSSYDKVASSNDYTVMYNSEIGELDFFSKDKSKIDSSIKLGNNAGIYLLNNNIFVYGISGQGIYLYNAETRNESQVIEYGEDFKIEKVENNTIYYDGKSIEVK